MSRGSSMYTGCDHMRQLRSMRPIAGSWLRVWSGSTPGDILHRKPAPRQRIATPKPMTTGPSNAIGEPLVRCEKRQGARFDVGILRLARPRQMNAVTADMCEAMLAQLQAWASDDSIGCVVLDGDGDRAFCSGGDVVAMARAIRAGGPQRYVYSDRGFAAEYRLVQSIFEFPKPLVSWAHGITMGAGFGLAMAASHRIVSPTLRLAMPESRIGLFPDVGATWFLGRAPGNCGPLIALSGAVLGAADALFTGLAGWQLPEALKEQTYAQLAASEMTGDAIADRAVVARAIAAAESSAGLAVAGSELSQRLDAIRRIGAARSVGDLRAALECEAQRDGWFAALAANIDAASPTSIHVGFEHFRRSRGKSLRETLATDLHLARAFVRGHDYPEGVRAALIDKDRRPDWQPARLADVSASTLAGYFDGGQ
jgi:enoyl-CoA hydratase/carnithine racemase